MIGLCFFYFLSKHLLYIRTQLIPSIALCASRNSVRASVCTDMAERSKRWTRCIRSERILSVLYVLTWPYLKHFVTQEVLKNIFRYYSWFKSIIFGISTVVVPPLILFVYLFGFYFEKCLTIENVPKNHCMYSIPLGHS